MYGQRAILVELSNLLDARLNVDELRNLCLDLHVDYDNLRDGNKKTKVWALIDYCRRRSQVDALFQACARQLPDVNWSEVMGKSETPLELDSRSAANSKISASFKLNYNFTRFHEFVQQAFSLEELIEFVEKSEDFKQLAFQLPRNASHVVVTQKLFEYARRRDKMQVLLGQFREYNPALYAKYEPFIESGKMFIQLELTVQGSDAQLWAAQARLKGEEFEQSVLRASEQVLQQAVE